MHDVIQVAMGWSDEHLWEFAADGRVVRSSGAARMRLDDLARGEGAIFGYLYDFGDCSEHLIAVGDVRPAAPGISYPRLIGGERNAPPDDSGGIPGFYAMVEALADPTHPDHEDMKDWAGDYDPAAFHEAEIGMALSALAGRWARAGSKRGRKAS